MVQSPQLLQARMYDYATFIHMTEILDFIVFICAVLSS